MPINEKGAKIMKSMRQQYGAKKGKSVFYASKNSGTIKAVEGKKSRTPKKAISVKKAKSPAKGNPAKKLLKKVVGK